MAMVASRLTGHFAWYFRKNNRIYRFQAIIFAVRFLIAMQEYERAARM